MKRVKSDLEKFLSVSRIYYIGALHSSVLSSLENTSSPSCVSPVCVSPSSTVKASPSVGLPARRFRSGLG